jgi:antitoxin MazE
MLMRAQISRWGNSLAVRLPRQLADSAGLGEGTAVELDIIDGTVRLTPARPSYTLTQLLAGITPDNIPESFDDAPHGTEML